MEESSFLVKGDGPHTTSGSERYHTFNREDAISNMERNSFRDSLAMIGLSARGSVRSSLNFGGKRVSSRDIGGKSTIFNSSANLIKNIVGAGVLALPSGVASFADSPTAVLPAIWWIVAMGAANGYSFQLIAKTCSMTSSVTYREAWKDTMGDKGAFLVSLSNMLKPALGNLAYSMILADTFQALFSTFGIKTTRTASLLLVTLFGILPLCLMKNLNALAPFSVLGTAGIFLTMICMTIRYFDGSYDPENGGRFLVGLSEVYHPRFGDYNGASTSSVLVFASMIFEAFMAHYNAPRFLAELKDSNIHRFRWVVSASFGSSGLIYVWLTAMGFLTFGANCDGYILNNYSTDDQLATICRVAIALSILFTYPIAFMGFRDGLLDVIELPQEQQTSMNINVVTIVLLTILTLIAGVCTDLGAVNAIGGGTLATLIAFVFPALMYRQLVADTPTLGEKREVKFALALMVIGVIMGFVGVVVELRRL